MKKRMFTLVLIAITALVVAPLAYADDAIGVTIEGQPVIFADQTPAIRGGRTLVPVRGVFEHLGFEVDWDDATRTAVLTSDTHEVRIPVGSDVFTTNGAEFTLDVPAQIIGGRTMVPIRLPLESVGMHVDWDITTRTVLVSKAPIGDVPAYITIRGEQISTAETELFLWGSMGLTDEDIVPLRYMTNLTHLDLRFNQIRDLTPLAGLTNLTYLNLVNNDIRDLTPLSNLMSLTELDLRGNRVADLSPLSNLTNIAHLYLWGLQFWDLSPITGLTNLVSLSIGDNLLFDGNLSDLRHFTKLTDLGLGDASGRMDFSPLETLINLERLSLWGASNLKDLSIFDDLKNMQNLTIHASGVTDFSPLSNLTNLTTLDLQQHQIGDISSIDFARLSNLTELRLWSNQITDIMPLATLTNLTFLHLSDNQITNVSPLSGMTNLIMLNLHNNHINDVTPLSEMTYLQQLMLDNNRISDISPLASLTNLASLSLDGNPITDWSPVAHVEWVDGRPD
ncbi:MAG: leucine-rich repeat domain-containing protein [Oscillospiraceae bacterium]|nr:leucine-rich repeat domain-containing protein [Oscillospiraceae bacterium]